MNEEADSGIPDLDARLRDVERLEEEIVRKAGPLLMAAGTFYHADLFVIGALRRTLAQARGFRDLISSRNFPCAAGILRMQIDTAMRVHGLSLVSDPWQMCIEILDGAKFTSFRDRDGQRLTDAYLRKSLSAKEPWINSVYEGTSDFVHLSGRHLFNSIERLEESDHTVYFVISGHDPSRPPEAYFEIVDAFFSATKLAGLNLLAFLTARAQSSASASGP